MTRFLVLGFLLAMGWTGVWVRPGLADGVGNPSYTVADTIRKDPDTGLAVDAQLPLVRAHCTSCHSSKLILQSRLSRPEWIERIRWMQRTQKLWDLGEAEPAVLDYLTKYYGPAAQPFDGRRLPLGPIRWRQ